LKPKKIFLEGGKIRLEEFRADHEWKIKYFLPFKPTKYVEGVIFENKEMLYKKQQNTKVIDEYYWKDGFVFNFIDTEKNKINKKNLTLVEMNTFQNYLKADDDSQQILEIKIKTNNHPLILFGSINESVKEFISKWIVGNVYDKIKFVTEKNSIGEEQPLKLGELHSNKVKCICAYCGKVIFINKKTTKECEMCFSKDFLIEGEIGLLKKIAQGGFGRILKSIVKKNLN
jgi:hypothetical protein